MLEYRWVVLCSYSLIISVGLIRHEPWRDETHAWLIVQLSHSVSELFHNIRYEGHPSLWFLLLYAIKGLGGSFATVQVVHGLIALATAYVLLTYAPFPNLTRLLLIGGYFFSYEYAVISRDYGIGVLLIFMMCVAFTRRHQFKGHLVFCLLMALLSQTNIFGLLVGGGLYGVTLLEVLVYRFNQLKTDWYHYAIGISIVSVGFGLALLAFSTPADTSYTFFTNGGWTFWNAQRCFEMFWNAYVPLPAEWLHFWNSNLLECIPVYKARTLLRIALAAGIIGLVLVPQFRSRLALIGWVVICLLIEYILFAHYFGSLRHHGHLFISFLALLWVQPQLTDFRSDKPVLRIGLTPAVTTRLWQAVLITQVITAGIAYAVDLAHPFSANQRVATYIQSQPVRHWFRAGDVDYAVEGIATYLPDHAMYYPASGQHGGFVQWNDKRHLINVTAVVDSVRLAKQIPALIILNKLIPPDKARLLNLSLLKSFTGSIREDEQYWLYRFDNRVSTPPPLGR